MQLKIGGDIGIVLSKGILCSLLTVILIMPILLDVFKNQIVKFKKKSNSSGSFYIGGDQVQIQNEKYLKIPNLGLVKIPLKLLLLYSLL